MENFINMLTEIVQFSDEEFEYFSLNFPSICKNKGVKKEVVDKFFNFIVVQRDKFIGGDF